METRNPKLEIRNSQRKLKSTNGFKGLFSVAISVVAVAILAAGCTGGGRTDSAIECGNNLKQWAARIPFSEKLSLENLIESSHADDFKQFQCPSGNPYFVADPSNYDQALKDKVLVYCDAHRTLMHIDGAVALSSASEFKATIPAKLLNSNDVGPVISCFHNMRRNLACAKAAYEAPPKGGSLAKLAESLRKNRTNPACPSGEPYWVCDPSFFDASARVSGKVFAYCEKHRVVICGNEVQLWDATDFKSKIPSRLLNQNNVSQGLEKAMQLVRMLSNG